MSTLKPTSSMTPPLRDFLGEGLEELKVTVAKTMQDCQKCAQPQKGERHQDNDNYLEVLQADVSELARRAAAERRESASHTIDMPNQLQRILEENHRLVLSLTEKTIHDLKEEQRIRHAEVLRTIQESRRRK